jgi:hypothetical protein
MAEHDFNWLMEHGPELYRRYAGKWIAVYKGEVIGVGDTALEAAEQARKKAKDGEYILEALDAEADVIYGCA